MDCDCDGTIGRQIIPARGWFAVHSKEDKTLWYDPLICWELQMDGDIVPLTVDSLGCIGDPTDEDGFVRLEYFESSELIANKIKLFDFTSLDKEEGYIQD